MNWVRKLAFAAPVLLFLLCSRPASAAGDLKTVLRQLDEAAKNFHTASAKLEWKSIQTEPVPDTDIKTGMVYFDRKGTEIQTAAHIETDNGQPFRQMYTVSQGVLKLYDEIQNHVTTYHYANIASYAMLGFGASGKDFENKFDVTYQGQETVGGVQTDKLLLIPKDQKVLNTFHSIVVWIDPVRDVDLKQVFDEGDGASLVWTYSDIQVNKPVSAAEFAFKTNNKTTYTNQ